MYQTLYCQNGGHYYDRVPVRARQPSSCVDDGGTGIPVKKYRRGSKAGEAAFATTGGLVKEQRNREAIDRAVKAAQPTVTTWLRRQAAQAAAPRKVPVRVAAGSNEGEQPSTEDDYPVTIDLNGRGGYRPETTAREQARILRAAFGEPVRKPEQPKHRSKATAAALVAPTIVEPETDAHAGEFRCKVGEHWSPRKSNRGKVPTVCDEHKAHPDYQREQATAARTSAEARGDAIADTLEARLRENGTHLSQNTDRFRLEERVGKRTWTPLKLTADNYGVKHWAKDATNAALLRVRRVRWVPVTAP